MLTRWRKNCRIIIALIAMVMLSTEAFAMPEDGVDWDRGVVRATGLGAGKTSSAKVVGVFKAQARRSAEMEAQRNLAELLNCIPVTSKTMTRDWAPEDYDDRPSFDTKIPEIVGEKYFSDNTCEIVIEMPLFGVENSVAALMFYYNKDIPKIPLPQPSTKISDDNTYTGLIVDCRGMDIQPIMLPAIKNTAGQIIYEYRNLDTDKVIEFGVVAYNNITRTGDNPLVVKAITLYAESDPVISTADADKILNANSTNPFLNNCSVTIITD